MRYTFFNLNTWIGYERTLFHRNFSTLIVFIPVIDVTLFTSDNTPPKVDPKTVHNKSFNAIWSKSDESKYKLKPRKTAIDEFKKNLKWKWFFLMNTLKTKDNTISASNREWRTWTTLTLVDQRVSRLTAKVMSRNRRIFPWRES